MDGMYLQEKTQKEKPSGFTFHVRMGEYELTLSGSREEVYKSVDDLPRLVASVGKAFDTVKPKTVATLTVKTQAAKQENQTQTQSQNYPRIAATRNCDEAVLRLLGTDWGKWRPRTDNELREALRANGLSFPSRAFPAVLGELVKSGKIRRWNTDTGFVYIQAEKETLGVKGEAE
jgi:hypothetical protein